MKYEFPLNEKVRTMLRLEHLFNRWDFFYAQNSYFDHHSAILTLFDIGELAIRLDLRTDLLKEVDRQINILTSNLNQIETNKKLLQDLNASLYELQQLFSRGILATEDKEWLYSIKSKSMIAGGTCQFDLPSYYAWQQQHEDERRVDLIKWVTPLLCLKKSTVLILNLLRQSSFMQQEDAINGIYQKMLSGKMFQLLQININQNEVIIPEVSGNKYMITIRFNQLDEKKNLKYLSSNINFNLILCNF